VSKTTLPFTVSLVDNWIDALRGYEGNRYMLDNTINSLITWIFRFGVPKHSKTNETCSIATHLGNGELIFSEGCVLLPFDPGELAALFSDYFGLSAEQLSQIVPNLGNVKFEAWSGVSNVSFPELSDAMIKTFGSIEKPITSSKREYSEIEWEKISEIALTESPLIGLEDCIELCLAALRSPKFVILLGPPGTGKTRLACYICTLAEKFGIPGYVTATATAEWTTFETIGGYYQSPENPSLLRYAPRIVTESLMAGKWLIIDELNRADIDKAFGELFTLFSGQKVRLPFYHNDKPVVLVPPGSSADENHEFPIYQKSDWRIIATMNTFDKASLFQLSYAFMRRFAFINVPVPASKDYVSILSGEINKAWADQDSESVATRNECLNFLIEIFTAETSGLGGINLEVGPAIPLDIINFIVQRFSIVIGRGGVISAKDLIIDGLEMYLYPQFEGRNMEHKQILSILGDILDPGESRLAQTERRLAVWTGYEEAL
jgi:MoxR-like ATPase